MTLLLEAASSMMAKVLWPLCVMAALFWLTVTSDDRDCNYLEREALEKRYRTSHLGRLFHVAIPSVRQTKGNASAELIFMCFQNVAEVTVRTPVDIQSMIPSYTVSQYYVNPRKDRIHSVDNSQRVFWSGVGWAITIRSSNDIIVQVVLDTATSDMMQLPPVRSFATKYTVYTIDIMSFVLVLASYDSTHVEYAFGGSVDTYRVLCNGEEDYCSPGEKVDFYIHGGGFSYVTNFDAKQLDKQQRSLRATTIQTSRPVLVIQGNQYKKSESSTKEKISLTPLYPEHVWGKTYLVPHDVQGGLTYRLMALSTSRTACRHSEDRFQLSPVYAVDGVRYVNVYAISGGAAGEAYTTLSCGMPFMAVLFADSEPAIYGFQFQLTPMKMWPSYAIFRKSVPVDNYLHIVKRKTYTILLNAKDTSQWQWTQVYDDNRLHFATHKVKDKLIRLTSLDYKHKFVAAVTAVSADVAMGTTLGGHFHFPEDTERCVQSILEMTLGDEIDNDCDGDFDEEVIDGKDNDRDVYIDEDGGVRRVDGGLGPWMSWFCGATCNRTGYIKRRRACDSPRPKNKGQYCTQRMTQYNSTCPKFDKGTCPTTCRPGKYQADCSADCPKNCLDKLCGRYTGICFQCEKGYKPSDYCLDIDYILPEFPDIIFGETITLKQLAWSVTLLLIPLSFLVLVLAFIVIVECKSRGTTLVEIKDDHEGEDEQDSYVPEHSAERKSWLNDLPHSSIY